MNFPLPSILAFAAMSGFASATVVNIDFNVGSSNNYQGLAAVLDDPAGSSAYWNPLVAAAGTLTSLPLWDSAGVGVNANTGIVFQVNSLPTQAGVSNPSGQQERSGGYQNLMQDYLRIDSGNSSTVVSVSGTFSNLVPSASYELYFYGQGEFFNTAGGTQTVQRGQNSLFTVNGISKQTDWDDVVGGNSALAVNIEYVKFTVQADPSGVIAFGWANVVQGTVLGTNVNVLTVGAGGQGDLAPSDATSGTRASRYAALNAIQLVEVVPEPSTALLSALGVIGLLARRRR